LKKSVVLSVMLVAACAAPEPKPEPGDPLSGTRWSLVSFGGSPVLASETTSLQFDRGRLSGSDGCNRYATSYSASRERLRVGLNVVSTRRACPPQVMEEAATFLSMLGSAAGFRRGGDRLTLLDRDGRPLADFLRVKP
jgi:heat shock protein HslJ